jgi:hypothetical protein
MYAKVKLQKQFILYLLIIRGVSQVNNREIIAKAMHPECTNKRHFTGKHVHIDN